MDYNDLNFGQLLFLLVNEVLKNNNRNIEKIYKRIVHLKNGIHFNEICIQEGLQPNFTNIYIYDNIFRLMSINIDHSNLSHSGNIFCSFHLPALDTRLPV